MISALHLLWIVPLSAFIGFMWAAMLASVDVAWEDEYDGR